MDYKNWSVFPIRLGVGIIFLVHGIGRFGVGPLSTNMADFAGFLGMVGIPLPSVFAWIVTLTETIGGIMILVGLFTELVALALTINMLVAIIMVHMPNGFSVQNGGIEFALILFLSSISLLLSGDGNKLSLESKIFDKKPLRNKIKKME